MRIGIVLAVLLVLPLALWLFLSAGKSPEPTVEPTVEPGPESAQAPAEVRETDEGDAAAAEDARRAAMQAAYAQLEVERLKLRNRLDWISPRLQRSPLGPAEAALANQHLAAAHMLLRNPPLLGAFSSEEQIREETARVVAAVQRLEELGERLNAARP